MMHEHQMVSPPDRGPGCEAHQLPTRPIQRRRIVLTQVGHSGVLCALYEGCQGAETPERPDVEFKGKPL
jgi:hypothetical protein